MARNSCARATRADVIKAELAHAKSEFRFWASQPFCLSRDERQAKARAEARVANLERELARERRR